jgi:hypothetical protein
MQDLFTPRYILHHLAEMTDRGHDDRRIAEQVQSQGWSRINPTDFSAMEVTPFASCKCG